MSAQPAGLPDYCWPVDPTCCGDWDDYDETTQARATAFAGATLRMLTGYRVGGCPITVRPCRQPCASWAVSTTYGFAAMGPVNWGGTWFNCMCGLDECGCGSLCQIDLPRPVGAISEVKADGVVLDASDYRVDDGHWLVRTDGDCWPDCQDLSQPDTEDGTFSVTYLNAVPVDGLGEYVAGVLACEFAKACSGGKCRLPSGVTSITRQGITMDLIPGAFPGGLTGIREVDAYVALYNPNHLKMPAVVWTPDAPKVRVTTWP